MGLIQVLNMKRRDYTVLGSKWDSCIMPPAFKVQESLRKEEGKTITKELQEKSESCNVLAIVPTMP